MSKAADGFYVATDTQVTVTGLKDVDGSWVNDAVLVGTLQTRSGQVVADGIPFFYTAASSGNYVGIIPASTPLKERTEYDLYIACTRGGRRMTLVIRRTATYLQG